MDIRKSVLVLARENDPQLTRLEKVPHTTGSPAAVFRQEAIKATAILHWSASRELLRTVFAMCPNVRWVHSRSAGLDSILFPELVQSDVILTNGRGVFSASLGECALAAILYFAKDFRRMIRNQSAERWEAFDVSRISGHTVGIIGYG